MTDTIKREAEAAPSPRSEFTRGDWEARRDLFGGYIVVINDGESLLGGETLSFKNARYAEGNACLIAASPKLYETLRFCRGYISVQAGSDPNALPYLERIDAALAKAAPQEQDNE